MSSPMTKKRISDERLEWLIANCPPRTYGEEIAGALLELQERRAAEPTEEGKITVTNPSYGEYLMRIGRWDLLPPREPPAPHIHNFKGPDGNMVCECGARMVSKEIAESLAESTDEQAFSPNVRAAELWINLVKDISATPCKCPDLRDSLVDWVRKQYRVEPEVSAVRTGGSQV